MSKRLQDIFEECIERLRQGDSVENCLRSYPKVAAELEILLRTALDVNWRASMVQPRPQFKARARAQFIAAQAKEAKPRPTFFSLQRAWVPALAVVLILVFSSVGTAAAASNAMPDEPLYPVKIATEQAQLTLIFSQEGKTELNTKLAETRSQEIATMATQGKTEAVVVATERLAQNLEAAEAAIQRIEETKTSQTLTTPQGTTTVPAQPAPAPEPTSTPAPEPPQPAPEPTPTPEPSTSGTLEKPQDKAEEEESQAVPSPINKAESLRQSLRSNIAKNIKVLENAKNEAPEKSKQAVQQAIDMAKSRESQLQQHPETQPKSPHGSGNSQNSPDKSKGN